MHLQIWTRESSWRSNEQEIWRWLSTRSHWKPELICSVQTSAARVPCIQVFKDILGYWNGRSCSTSLQSVCQSSSDRSRSKMIPVQRLAPNSRLLQSSRWRHKLRNWWIWWTATTNGTGLIASLCLTDLLSDPKSLSEVHSRFLTSLNLLRLQMPIRTQKWSSKLNLTPWCKIQLRSVIFRGLKMYQVQSLLATSDCKFTQASPEWYLRITQNLPLRSGTNATRLTTSSHHLLTTFGPSAAPPHSTANTSTRSKNHQSR